MKASVIIPTYRDWPRLLQCLAALERQTLARDTFEIIVVDNDPESIQPPPLPAGVIYLHEPRGFSYAARNAGAKRAIGHVLAFTDADCLPQPNWLESGLAELNVHPDWGLQAGRVEIFSDVHNVVFRYEALFEFQQETWVRLMQFGATANLFARRAVFDAVQGFNAMMKSGGDADFCHRCRAAGFTIGYVHMASVMHPSRRTVSEVLRKNRRIALGFYGHARRDTGGDRLAIWKRLPRWWRPRPREWLHILTGERGSRRFRFRHRFSLLALHMLLHYHTAWCMLRSHLTHERSDNVVR